MGLFHGVPTTQKSVFARPTGADHIVLYQKNIEAVCSTETEIHQQVRGGENGAKPRGEDRGWGSPVSSGREGAGAERKQNH